MHQAKQPVSALLTGPYGHPEGHLPVPVIIGHGAWALVTLRLVLLTAAGAS